MESKKTAIKVVERLQSAGYTTYFSGGWVRDFLLKVPSDDIDIATNATVEEVQRLFPKTIPVGIAFGIIIVVEDGYSFEVATFRKEDGYTDGRRPSTIEPASPEEDALRRDFTINGMFFDPVKQKLFDFVDGQKDLETGIIRAIGDPHQRFLEDRLRMIRAVRYSARFHFPIDCDTKEAILSHANSLFPSVAIERVWQEFQKMEKLGRFNLALVTLHEIKLLPVIFPELKEVSASEIKRRLSPLALLPGPCPLIAQVLFLFPESSLETKLELSDYLKLSKQERKLIEFLHSAETLLNMPLAWQAALEDLEWAHFYANPSSFLALDICLSQKTDSEKEGLIQFHQEKRKALLPHIDRIQEKKPLITASDLKNQGILPGVQMGQLLQEAERISINEHIEDKETALKRLKEVIDKTPGL